MIETTTLRQMLPENLKTYADSVFLMSKTSNPQTFFERYHAACDIADNIAAAYCMCEMYDDVDEWCERKERLIQSKDDLLTDMVNRMYETRRIDLIQKLVYSYSYELSPQLEEHIEYLLRQ